MENTRGDIFDRMMDLSGLQVLKPWCSKHKEVLLYLFFGGPAVLLNLALFVLFTKCFSWGALLTNVIDQVICALFQFITNKTWVLDAEIGSAKGFWAQLAGSFSRRLLTLDVGGLMLFVFVDRPHWNSLSVKLVVQVVVIASNYVVSRFSAFKKKD